MRVPRAQGRLCGLGGAFAVGPCVKRQSLICQPISFQSMKHLLPVAFQDVRQFMESYRGRNAHMPLFNLEKDQHGFRENCVGIFQPDVKFSHNSLWHAG